jgi:hypothetical protein
MIPQQKLIGYWSAKCLFAFRLEAKFSQKEEQRTAVLTG